ncbi:MAG TPA: VanZ family protein [Candidatus Mediterraneibacter merdavium]|nr:VanZ family protein [Candidatus Mediterraneibacter merdavium]
MRNKIFLILAVLWMAVIFSFSARPAEQSTGDSRWAGHMIGQLFVPGFGDWSDKEQEAFAEKVDYPVRKTAHAMEYAVLGLLTAGAYIRRGTSIRKGILVPWGIAALYAASDEFHQLFVPGRSGQVSDVVLDSAGVLAGVLLLAGIRRARNRVIKE